MMLLVAGEWLGKGSLLLEGRTLGETIEAEAQIEADETGLSIRLQIVLGENSRQMLVRVAANDVGTYVVSVRSEIADTLMGTAKLDSEPNLGLLWNDAGTIYATFSLFSHSGGLGCRGFARSEATTYTWEVAFSRKQQVVKGDNVVSLRRRRR
jgi:hypothetical protein